MSISLQNNTLTLAPSEDLTANCVREINNQWQQAIENNPNLEKITLDLLEVNFVDSSGIGLIVALHKECRTKRQIPLSIQNASPTIQEIFQVVNLEDILT